MDELEARFGDSKRSSFVRTPAMTWKDAPPGPDYLNAAMSFECALPLAELLALTQSLERLFGRKKSARWANRTLDLDILWAPMSCEAPRVPHPGLLERDFALGPAMEVEVSLREEHTERLRQLGGMPTIVLPPIIEQTANRVLVRRAMDASDALALAWGATGQTASMLNERETSVPTLAWVEAAPSSPLGAASACVDTAEGHFIRPAPGHWELESLGENSCVLREIDDAKERG
ncbi:MAG: 2-amino-4-hydroxy-6-hydroxymethyldihydropteridine diphosphokinase [Polyangiales bacterium]|jgi:2-amino-4-hydroxy-6-hydroxymethyldihydropteridine diphosphokinase